MLTQKRLEMHWCIISSVATAALVLKHQVTKNHSADKLFTAIDEPIKKILHSQQTKLFP